MDLINLKEEIENPLQKETIKDLKVQIIRVDKPQKVIEINQEVVDHHLVKVKYR